MNDTIQSLHYPKNGSWNALNPSTAAEAAALRANGLLTNWVSLEKTVRADPEPAEGSKHGRFFMTSTAGFRFKDGPKMRCEMLKLFCHRS